MSLAMTPTRWAWLLALAERARYWSELPYTRRGRLVSRTTWGPMISAGWIRREVDLTQGPSKFVITDLGRALIGMRPPEPRP